MTSNLWIWFLLYFSHWIINFYIYLFFIFVFIIVYPYKFVRTQKKGRNQRDIRPWNECRILRTYYRIGATLLFVSLYQHKGRPSYICFHRLMKNFSYYFHEIFVFIALWRISVIIFMKYLFSLPYEEFQLLFSWNICFHCLMKNFSYYFHEIFVFIALWRISVIIFINYLFSSPYEEFQLLFSWNICFYRLMKNFSYYFMKYLFSSPYEEF